jgi:hypothetical protein
MVHCNTGRVGVQANGIINHHNHQSSPHPSRASDRTWLWKIGKDNLKKDEDPRAMLGPKMHMLIKETVFDLPNYDVRTVT